MSERNTGYKWPLEMTVSQTARLAGGKVLAGAPDQVIRALAHDTRERLEGVMFLAIAGENFNGHDFVGAALEKGAAGAMVSEDIDLEKLKTIASDIFVIQVDDTVAALGRLACARRMSRSIPIIAVAGSAGKTTTKEMLAHIFQTQFRTHKNRGNLNNLIGVPLTIFELRPDHQIAVIELGMNQPGELERLTRIVAPTVSVLTNIGEAHVGMFDTPQGLIDAKSEFIIHSPKSTTVYSNADCEKSQIALAKHLAGRRNMTVGESKSALARVWEIIPLADGYRFTLRKERKDHTFEIHMFGRSNIQNAAIAATVALDFRIDTEHIAEALEKFRPSTMRSETLTLGELRLIADCYNASPEAVIAAVDSLAETWSPGRKVMVLADMLELGAESERLHRAVGRKIGESGISLFIAFGPMTAMAAEEAASQGVRVQVAESIEEIVSTLATQLTPNDIALIKGARGARMERVVEGLKQRLQNGETPETDKA